MGSHSVTCHPTQVNSPRLTPASRQAGTRFTYPGGMEGWVDLGDLLVAYRDGLPACNFQVKNAGFCAFLLRKTPCGPKPGPGGLNWPPGGWKCKSKSHGRGWNLAGGSARTLVIFILFIVCNQPVPAGVMAKRPLSVQLRPLSAFNPTITDPSRHDGTGTSWSARRLSVGDIILDQNRVSKTSDSANGQ